MLRNAVKIVIALALCLVIQTRSIAAGSFVQDAPPTFAEAQRYLQEESFEKAVEAWAAILEEEPDNAAARFYLAYSLHAAGDLEEAIEAHKKAATYDQYKGVAIYNLACAYSLLGETDQAFKALKACSETGFDMSNADTDSDFDSIRNDPRFSLIVHGGASAEKKENSKSNQGNANRGGNMEEMFQFVAMRMQPIIQELMPQVHERFAKLAEQAKMHVQEIMGQVHQKISEDEELAGAIEKIHQALSENPKFRGIMQKIQGAMGGGGGNPGGSHEATQPSVASVESAPLIRIEEARPEVIEETRAVVTEKVPSLSDAGSMQQSGQYKEAAKAFGAILKSQPDNASASFGYAYNLHMSGDYKAAIEAHKAAAEFDDLSGIANYNLGCAYALTGQADKAVDALEASAEFGFDVLGSMKSDSDLNSLRKNERFINLQKILEGGE